MVSVSNVIQANKLGVRVWPFLLVQRMFEIRGDWGDCTDLRLGSWGNLTFSIICQLPSLHIKVFLNLCRL